MHQKNKTEEKKEEVEPQGQALVKRTCGYKKTVLAKRKNKQKKQKTRALQEVYIKYILSIYSKYSLCARGIFSYKINEFSLNIGINSAKSYLIFRSGFPNLSPPLIWTPPAY